MNKIKKINGFTLIEILMSIFMISTMFIIFQTALGSSLLTRKINRQEIALRIAAAELETVRALTYGSLPSSGPFANSSLSSLPQSSGAITVTSKNSKTKQIIATVFWKEPGSNVTSSISLKTFITEGGL